MRWLMSGSAYLRRVSSLLAPVACARSRAPLHLTVGQDGVHLQLLGAVVDDVEIYADAAVRAAPLILLDVSGRYCAHLRLGMARSHSPRRVR